MKHLGLWLVVIAAGGAGAAPWLAAAPPVENQAAADYLAKRGLTRANHIWLSPVEVKLKGYLDSLKDLENNLKQAEGTVVNGFKRNEALKAEITALEMNLKQIGDLLQSGRVTGERAQKLQEQGQQLAKRIEELKTQVVDPSGFDENQAVKSAVIRWIEARNAATLAVLYIRQNAEAVPDSYKKYADDKDIRDALAALGDKHKLGPAKKYDRDVRRIEKLEKMCLTDRVPTYRDNTVFRVSAIVNEQAATTFTYTDQANVTFIPASVADAAGIKIPASAQKVSLALEGDRKIDARLIKIPKLRFGKHVLDDVEALVLAPDAEDMGALLSPQSLVGYKPNVDATTLEFILEPLAGSPSEAAGDDKPAGKPRERGEEQEQDE